VIYLTRVMGFDSSNAAAQVIFFEGTCFLTPLLGAWLADSLWGRYKTILFFSYIYLIGLLLLVLSVIAPGLAPVPGQEHANLMQNAALFFALYTIALGTGGIKPNVRATGLQNPAAVALSAGERN
jgi:peptide/histidine transporter 3/4